MRNQVRVLRYTLVAQLISVAAVVSMALTLFSTAQGDVLELDFIEVNVRIEHPAGSGTFVNDKAEIRLKPNATNPNDFGSVTKYTGNDSLKANCHGQKYNHAVYQIDPNWTDEVAIGNVTYTVNKSHNEAYWDWYYRDYEQVSEIDYSQNCHGYAFGVGDWPDEAGTLLDLGNPNVNQRCYLAVPIGQGDLMTIASDPPKHSIKVTGDSCEREEENGGDPPIVLTVIGNFHKTSFEKMRESGVYKRTGGTCADPLNLNLAHARDANDKPISGGGFSFGDYYPNPGGGGGGGGKPPVDRQDPPKPSGVPN